MKCVLSFEYVWMGPEMTEHDKFCLSFSYALPPASTSLTRCQYDEGARWCVCVWRGGGGGVGLFVSISLCFSPFLSIFVSQSLSVVLCLLFSVSVSPFSSIFVSQSLCVVVCLRLSVSVSPFLSVFVSQSLSVVLCLSVRLSLRSRLYFCVSVSVCSFCFCFSLCIAAVGSLRVLVVLIWRQLTVLVTAD